MTEKQLCPDELDSTKLRQSTASHGAGSSRWSKFKEWAKRGSTFTDWCLAAFTLALAVTGVYQFVIIWHQLDVMRTDQRAWLQFQAQPDKPGVDTTTLAATVGQPIMYPFRVTNSGKTPATNVSMSIYLDIVDASREPALETVDQNLPHAHAHVTSGIIFPNADFKAPTYRLDDSASPLPATQAEVTAIAQGKAYMAVYGIITYDDVFGAHHWTKFCTWPATNGSFHTYRCTQFNSVDAN